MSPEEIDVYASYLEGHPDDARVLDVEQCRRLIATLKDMRASRDVHVELESRLRAALATAEEKVASLDRLRAALLKAPVLKKTPRRGVWCSRCGQAPMAHPSMSCERFELSK